MILLKRCRSLFWLWLFPISSLSSIIPFPARRCHRNTTLSCWTALVGDQQQTSDWHCNDLVGSSQSLACNSFQKLDPRSHFNRSIQYIFDTADINNDGTISFDECYALVLRLYVRLNRHAPIPPPSRQTVQRLYGRSDRNANQRINREEFSQLAHTVGRRALYRMVAHKVVTLVVAPVLAQATAQRLRGNRQLPRVAKVVLPKRFHQRMLPMVTSETFGSTVLLVFFVSTLGNVVVRSVNYALSCTVSKDEEW